jgi:predicted phage terminase large subunit-like protein
MTKKPTLGPSSEAHKKFLNCKSSFVIFGGGAGSGKSHQALMLILKYVKDPNFKAVFIRQTSTQLSQAGGLYQEAQVMWRQYGAKFKSHPQMTATFPSGAEVQFKVCGADRDIINFDGGQFSLVIFDEAQWHSEVQIKYLESRIRSNAKGPHQLICTMNPLLTSYVYQFVKFYLDMETGIPKQELSGVERYYAVYSGSTVTADTKEELIELYGEGCKPQTYTYICATVADNPIMRQINPTYVTRLENLKRTERERLYLGSWHAKQDTAGYFKREWVEELDAPPSDTIAHVRGMDLAASLASESYPNPDWTASVLMSKTKSGYYILEHAERYRKLSNGVQEQIVETDKKDKAMGVDCIVHTPTDPGAGGRFASMHLIRYLVEHGVTARAEQGGTTTGKLTKMQPFLALAEAGLVKVVKGPWLDMWYDELEDFIEGNRQQKDDLWDSTATATKALLRQVVLPTFSIPSMVQASPIPTV